MFQSNAMITTLSQHTFTARKLSSGLNTKWDSFTPRNYKINFIRTLTYHCLRVCSSTSLPQSAFNDLTNLVHVVSNNTPGVAIGNGYPRGVIAYNMNDVVTRNRNKPKDSITTVPKRDVSLTIMISSL